MDTIFHMYGDNAVEMMLRKPSERAGHMKPAFEKVGKAMLKDERLLFDTSGFSGNAPWRPLAKSTIARKRSANAPQPTRPMFAFGDLQRSLSVKGAPFNLFRATRLFVLVGSTHPAVGPTTTGAPAHGQPVRDVLAFSTPQIESYIDILSDHIFGDASA